MTKVNKHVFENGLTLLHIEKKDFQKKFASVFVNFGAKNIQDEKVITDGIAHFLEHKMFEKEDGDYLEDFNLHGANANAFTSFNETVYYFSCVNHFTENFNTLLSLVSELKISDQSVEKEKSIIIEEINMYQSDPETKMFQRLVTNMYKNAAVKYDILGSKQSVSSITKEELQRVFKNYYIAKNMVIVVVGDFNNEQIIKQILSHPITLEKNQTLLSQPIIQEQAIVVRLEDTIYLPVEKEKCLLGYKLAPINDFKERKKIESCIKILATMSLTTLNKEYQNWIDQQLISDYFGFYVDFSETHAMFVMYDETSSETQLETLFEKLCNVNVTQDQLMLVKKRLYGSHLFMLDQFERLAITVGRTHFANVDFTFESELIKELTIDNLINSQKYLKKFEKSKLFVKKEQN